MSVDLPGNGIRYLGRNFLSVKVSEVVRVREARLDVRVFGMGGGIFFPCVVCPRAGCDVFFGVCVARLRVGRGDFFFGVYITRLRFRVSTPTTPGLKVLF